LSPPVRRSVSVTENDRLNGVIVDSWSSRPAMSLRPKSIVRLPSQNAVPAL
jgi:hypothetical protein